MPVALQQQIFFRAAKLLMQILLQFGTGSAFWIQYWVQHPHWKALSSWKTERERKYDYICNNVHTLPVARRRARQTNVQGRNAKSISHMYFFCKKDCPQPIQVCNRIFCATLAIDKSIVKNVFKQKNGSGMYAGANKKFIKPRE